MLTEAALADASGTDAAPSLEAMSGGCCGNVGGTFFEEIGSAGGTGFGFASLSFGGTATSGSDPRLRGTLFGVVGKSGAAGVAMEAAAMVGGARPASALIHQGLSLCLLPAI